MRTTAAFGRHAGMALLEAFLVAILLAALVAGYAAVAGIGHDTMAGRYSVHVADGSFGSTTDARVYGDRTDYWVAAKCYQNGTLVYAEWVKTDAAGHATLLLGPTELWTSGSADCIADAGFYSRNFNWKKVASTTFVAAGS